MKAPYYSPDPEVPTLKNLWHEQRTKTAWRTGVDTTRKSLEIVTRFDGYGNSTVRFAVWNGEKELQYEKFDAAVDAYNAIR